MRPEQKILVISGAAFAVLFVIAISVKNVVLSTNLVFLGMLVLTVPYSVAKFFQFKRMRQYEKQLPNFLRDLAESQRAGLSILQAMKEVSKNDYGQLSKEIIKMNNQLSWNIPLEKVLKDFAKRMGRSQMIVRSLMVIDQANKSGGSIENTMDSLASHIEMIKEVQEEKSILLNQQVVLMYAIFFVFLGITIALLKFLVPLLQSQLGSVDTVSIVQGFGGNPCNVCVGSADASCLGCTIFSGVAAAFDFGSPEDPASYYRALFFTMILVQGFFTGLIAGQISSDSIAAGVKHSLILTLTGFIIYMFVVKTGLA